MPAGNAGDDRQDGDKSDYDQDGFYSHGPSGLKVLQARTVFRFRLRAARGRRFRFARCLRGTLGTCGALGGTSRRGRAARGSPSGRSGFGFHRLLVPRKAQAVPPMMRSRAAAQNFDAANEFVILREGREVSGILRRVQSLGVSEDGIRASGGFGPPLYSSSLVPGPGGAIFPLATDFTLPSRQTVISAPCRCMYLRAAARLDRSAVALKAAR